MKYINSYLFVMIFLVPMFLICQPDSLDKKKTEEVMKQYKKTYPDTVKNEIPKKFEMKKSPMGAVIRSLILPGWGQFYVESYLKAPIITVGSGFLIYMIVDLNKKFVSRSNLVDKMIKDNPNDVNIFMEKQYREYYRDNRDMSAFYLLAVYVVAAVDCYTDAHLFDFNVEDKFSLGLVPNFLGGVNLNFSYKIR